MSYTKGRLGVALVIPSLPNCQQWLALYNLALGSHVLQDRNTDKNGTNTDKHGPVYDQKTKKKLAFCIDMLGLINHFNPYPLKDE